jgi:phospholipid/cholesterol/gamma-HCH transport system substrate-binding protein
VNKQGPSKASFVGMGVFALGCFGILLFLWHSFGGSIPLKAEGYRVEVAFPEAIVVADQADVRISGVPVGKVRRLEPDVDANTTVATIEIEKRYAPLPSDTRAMVRRKSLLGEAFIELTPGDRRSPPLADGARVPQRQVQETVELDEILEILDPATRTALRRWQGESARALDGRGEELSNAFGTLPYWARDTHDLLAVLDTQRESVSGLVRNTGAVFEALTRDENRLQDAVSSSSAVFRSTAAESEALSETVAILPTFLDESRLTLVRLERFAADTRPLVRDLRPPARELGPTMRATRALAPDLLRLFRRLPRVVDASRTGLPAANGVLRAARPLLGSLGSLLGELNPILDFAAINQYLVSDFLTLAAVATADRTTAGLANGSSHHLRTVGPVGLESAGIYPERLPTNRGNSYLSGIFEIRKTADFGIFPNFDCKPSGGEVRRQGVNSPDPRPACFVQQPQRLADGSRRQYPHVNRYRYDGR